MYKHPKNRIHIHDLKIDSLTLKSDGYATISGVVSSSRHEGRGGDGEFTELRTTVVLTRAAGEIEWVGEMEKDAGFKRSGAITMVLIEN